MNNMTREERFAKVYTDYFNSLNSEQLKAIEFIVNNPKDKVFAIAAKTKYIHDYDVRIWYSAEDEYLRFEIENDIICYESKYYKPLNRLTDDIEEFFDNYFNDSLKTFDDMNIRFLEDVSVFAYRGDIIAIQELIHNYNMYGVSIMIKDPNTQSIVRKINHKGVF